MISSLDPYLGEHFPSILTAENPGPHVIEQHGLQLAGDGDHGCDLGLRAVELGGQVLPAMALHQGFERAEVGAGFK